MTQTWTNHLILEVLNESIVLVHVSIKCITNYKLADFLKYTHGG